MLNGRLARFLKVIWRNNSNKRSVRSLLLIFVCLIISVVLAYLTHMDLIVDFSFQKWAQQCISRVFPPSERSVCVFYIHHLFILIAQVMGGCRQMSRLQLPDVSKRKETIIVTEFSNFLWFFFSSFLHHFYLSVCSR